VRSQGGEGTPPPPEREVSSQNPFSFRFVPPTANTT
jgi:hypothetical protein